MPGPVPRCTYRKQKNAAEGIPREFTRFFRVRTYLSVTDRERSDNGGRVRCGCCASRTAGWRAARDGGAFLPTEPHLVAPACNIEPSEGGVVEGLVMKISPAIREALRAKEGWPVRYQEVMVNVMIRDRREPIRALTYIVAADHRLDVDMPVTPAYRRFVLDGARAAGLSKSYQEQLARTLRTTESPCNLVRNAVL